MIFSILFHFLILIFYYWYLYVSSTLFFACVVYVCMYAYSCEWIQMCVSTCADVCMWRPKKTSGAALHHSPVIYCSKILLSLILASLPKQFAPGITYFYLLRVEITTGHYSCPPFLWVLGIPTPVFLLAQ